VRVGLAVGHYEPQVGGSEAVVRRIATGLQDRGHDVLVATATHPDRRPGSTSVPVREFAVRGNLAHGLAGDVLGYQQFLRTTDRDVWLFYAAQIWSTDAALPLLAQMPCATAVVPCGYSGLHRPEFADYFRALPSFLADADALLYMSDSYQDAVHDEAAGLGHLRRILPNGAGEDEFGGLAEARRPRRRGITVLTVANHIPAKGHRDAIAAFRRVAGPDDRLVVVGEVHDTDPRRTCWYRCKAVSLVDRRVVLARGLPREEVVALYGQADVFLLASEVECSPLVVIEAMAAGVPFVSTDAGNVRDWSDSGLVAGREDLPSALRSLLTDPGLRDRLGSRGRDRWRSDHSWERLVPQYEELFTELCRRREGTRC
jgi:L-malate glycosyltransferase